MRKPRFRRVYLASWCQFRRQTHLIPSSVSCPGQQGIASHTLSGSEPFQLTAASWLIYASLCPQSQSSPLVTCVHSLSIRHLTFADYLHALVHVWVWWLSGEPPSCSPLKQYPCYPIKQTQRGPLTPLPFILHVMFCSFTVPFGSWWYTVTSMCIW